MAALYLGLQARRARFFLRCAFTGPEGRLPAIRAATADLADRANDATSFVDELERVAADEGFVLETEPLNRDELHVYMWYMEPSGILEHGSSADDTIAHVMVPAGHSPDVRRAADPAPRPLHVTLCTSR